MKIIFLCNEYPPVLHGGTGSFVKSMAEYLAPLHDIIVIGAYSDVRKLTVYRENKVTVHKIPMKPEKSKWVFLINRLNLSIYVNRVIKENRIDIVEAFDTNAWFLFLKKKPPVFVRLHNGERYTTKQRGSFVKLVEGLSFSRRDSYIAVSKAIRKEFLFFFNLKSKHYDRYTKVIYNGIHLDQFPVIPAGSYDKNKIVFVGTLKKVKGVNVLIEVFLRLRKSIPELYLSIIGGDTHEMGGYKNYLIDHFGIHEMVNTGVVTFHGRMNRQEINEQLRSALVCVVPSIFESFGLVTIEAMACFVPVICTRVGANPEIIDSGVNGFIIDSGDVNQLGILIQELYEGKYNRELLILRARKDVEKHFSIQFCAQQTLRFYEERLQ